jgi:hypothetical protein
MRDYAFEVITLACVIISHCCLQLFGGGDKRKEPVPVTDSSEQFDYGFSSSIGAAASDREQLDTDKSQELGSSSSGGRKQRNAVPQRPTFGQRANTAAVAAGGRATL